MTSAPKFLEYLARDIASVPVGIKVYVLQFSMNGNRLVLSTGFVYVSEEGFQEL